MPACKLLQNEPGGAPGPGGSSHPPVTGASKLKLAGMAGGGGIGADADRCKSGTGAQRARSSASDIWGTSTRRTWPE